MKNTEQAVGANTSIQQAKYARRKSSIKNTKTYICTHPSFGSKKYVGATYDDLAAYNTSSSEIQEAVAKTGIRPEFTVIENFIFDANTAQREDFQFVFKREQEIYDLLIDMGVELINAFRPSGHCPYADPVATKVGAEKRKGVGNHKYDHTIYEFTHVETREILLTTQHALRHKYQLDSGELVKMLNGDTDKTVKGWILKSTLDSSPVLKFTHNDGSTFVGTKWEFISKYPKITIRQINRTLATDGYYSSSGWSIQPKQSTTN
jgi:hypothetical protein